MSDGNESMGNGVARALESAVNTVKSTSGRSGGKPPGFLFLFFGVVLPVLVIGIELSTRMCAVEFFDPMPTIWHAIVVVFVPLANLAVWPAVRGRHPWHPRLMGIANGFAIGVAAYYTILFLPILPLALIAVIWLIGFLPMAPLFSLIAAVRARIHLKRFARQEGIPQLGGLIAGLMLFIAVMVCLEAQSTLTRIGLKMAASVHKERQLQGIRLLRAVGDDELLLRSCYKRVGLATDLVGVFVFGTNPVSPKKVREIYYRVTGAPFNSVEPPRLFAANRSLLAGIGFDPAAGGDAVAGRVGGVSMVTSRIGGSVDADAALAYVEWTLEFKNDSIYQQEARAQIQLPPGAVVSRLTLWIDGEPREGVFAKRANVSKAYKEVVRKKRDPVLVTTQGPDRVLLQCFPVLPQGGQMKARLGITAPLVMVNRKSAYLRLPQFLERNFSIAPDTKHLVWVESRRQLLSPGKSLEADNPASGLHGLRGALTDAELAAQGSVIEALRSAETGQVWATDSSGDTGEVIVQTLTVERVRRANRVVLVVDGSAAMNGYNSAIAESLARMPVGLELGVLVASDDVGALTPDLIMGTTETYEEISERLKQIRFQGGCDNVPALAKAWDLAAGRSDSVIVWIHGPQPILMRSPDELLQKWERRPGNPRLYEVAVLPGPNRVVEKLDTASSVKLVPRLGGLDDDLARLFSRWSGQGTKITIGRERISGERKGGDLQQAKESSAHLARLWAHDQIMKLLSTRGNGGTESARELAVRYCLVTPVTGAVVLENNAQYLRAGLTPPSSKDVPTIPEPETYLLVVVSLAALAWLTWNRRQRWGTV